MTVAFLNLGSQEIFLIFFIFIVMMVVWPLILTMLERISGRGPGPKSSRKQRKR